MKCPSCNGEADNGFSRELPPAAYACTKCEGQPKPYTAAWLKSRGWVREIVPHWYTKKKQPKWKIFESWHMSFHEAIRIEKQQENE